MARFDSLLTIGEERFLAEQGAVCALHWHWLAEAAASTSEAPEGGHLDLLGDDLAATTGIDSVSAGLFKRGGRL